jgi:hypothetical protein
MTSAINYSLINKDFPIAGQDNDSVGFRNNFAATQTALHTARDEITALQTNSVLKADLTANTPVVNNMLGSAIFNATYAQFNGIFYDAGSVSGLSVNVDLNNGPIQRFIITQGSSGSPTVLTFVNWPPAGTYAVVRLMLVSSRITPGNWNVSLQTTGGGTIQTATGFTPIVVPTSGKYEMVEAWTVDHGQNVFVKSIGEY